MTTASSADKNLPLPVSSGLSTSESLPTEKGRNRELFRIRSSHLADLFPDELVVQEKTISVVRNGALVSYVETLPVRDIGRTVYITMPIFASLRIIGKNPSHELYINGLRKSQAQKAKEIIDGLLLEDKGVVDVPDWMHIDERREVLADAGRGSSDQKVPHTLAGDENGQRVL